MEQLKRGYNLFTAIAMIVGIVIGSGIFLSPMICCYTPVETLALPYLFSV